MKAEYDKIAHLYDEFLFFEHEKIYYNSLLQFIRENSPKDKGLNLLDIACGTGNFLSIIERDYNCYGFDISNRMLAIAKKKLSNETKLIQQDYRYFQLQRKFNIITCLFDSLNHTKDVELVFNSVRNHLKKDGVFIFDYYTRYGLDKCVSMETEYLSVKKNDDFYQWEIKGDNGFVITQYVIKMKVLFETLNLYFRFDIYNQNFIQLTINDVHLDSLVEKNKVERIIIMAKLK